MERTDAVSSGIHLVESIRQLISMDIQGTSKLYFSFTAMCVAREVIRVRGLNWPFENKKKGENLTGHKKNEKHKGAAREFTITVLVNPQLSEGASFILLWPLHKYKMDQSEEKARAEAFDVFFSLFFGQPFFMDILPSLPSLPKNQSVIYRPPSLSK